VPAKLQIVAGFIAAAVAHELATRPLRKQYIEAGRLALKLSTENKALQEQMEYLINVLNENDVFLDEFDLIVLTNVTT
jgi:hypothetical protein